MNTTVKRAVEALIDFFDGQGAAATAIGVKQPTISAWLNEGHGVSAKNALSAERATKGTIKAEDLCPDLVTISTKAA